jgi:hypothetical protein
LLHKWQGTRPADMVSRMLMVLQHQRRHLRRLRPLLLRETDHSARSWLINQSRNIVGTLVVVVMSFLLMCCNRCLEITFVMPVK